jgi:small-conductance mechanosensitive channel
MTVANRKGRDGQDRKEGAMNDLLSWLEQNNFILQKAIVTVALLCAASIAIFLSNRLIWNALKTIERRLSLTSETVLGVARSITGLLWFVAGMLILSLWGVSVSGVWTLLVSIAAVVGVGFLAVWAMISNVTAGLFITIWRPFHLGHTIELLPENLKGRAVDRNMMFTVMREESGALLHVPNNLFFQKMFRVSGRSDRSHFEFLEGPDRDTVSRENGSFEREVDR